MTIPLPILPRAVRIRGREDADIVSAALDEAGQSLPLILPPDAGSSLGGGFAARLPRRREIFLDCGGRAGPALAALRAGHRFLIVDPALPAAPRLAALAETLGARLMGGAADVFEPAPGRRPYAGLADWL
jgi:hypothetical protein